MKITLSTCLMLLFVLASAPAQALEPFALLDDFSGDRIDAGIWNGSRRPDSNTIDVAREVQGGELRLMGRTYADPTAAPGSIGRVGRVRLQFNNSDPVTQMLALVRVNAVELNDCTAPSTVSEIRGRLDGWFFTTGGPPAPLDATRNVTAEIGFRRRSDSIDPPGAMQLRAFVFQCGDAGCVGGNTVFSDTTSLGTITPGQSVVLVLLWDPDNDRFIFLRTPPLGFAVYDYAGILTDVDPPSPDLSFVAKPRLEIRAAIENCVSGPPASGFMEFFVDQLWLNQSAVGP